jgi:hypothetical protein
MQTFRPTRLACYRHPGKLMTPQDASRALWESLRKFAATIRIDSLKVGPATLRFVPPETINDAFGAIMLKLSRSTGRLNDVFVISAHNMDEVTRVDQIEPDHESAALSEPMDLPGGSGANTAFALGMLGHHVSIAGCVGDDEAGRHLVDSLRHANVNTSLMSSVDSRTGRTVNLVGNDGRRLLVVHPGANNAFAKNSSHSDLVAVARESRIVHMSSFVDTKSMATQLRLARDCSESVVISLTPGALYACPAPRFLVHLL